MSIQVFYVDPLVMAIPAIESYNRIPVPVHRVIQKDRPLAFLAASVNFVNILILAHYLIALVSLWATFFDCLIYYLLN